MMKKTFSILCIVSILFLIVGCASKTSVPTENQPLSSLGQSGQPDWLYKSYSNDTHHYESGYSKLSNKQNSIKAATADARTKMAEWINTNVTEVIGNYVNDAGSGDNRQAFDVFEVLGVQIAQASLSGVMTEDMWFDADGAVWVLCSIPLENIESQFAPAAETVAETFQANEAAEAANEKMKEAFSRLLSAK